jgi:hypothetical protein
MPRPSRLCGFARDTLRPIIDDAAPHPIHPCLSAEETMKPRLPLQLLAVAALLAMPLVSWAQETKTPETKAATQPIEKGLRVFSIGNSFHWFVAPILKDLAQGAGIPGHEFVGDSRIGGSRAIQHWEKPDDKNPAKTALKSGKVDVLTLGVMHTPDPGIEKFAALGLENNPNFRVSMQEFWMPFDMNKWPVKADDQKSVDPDTATPEFLRKLHEPYYKLMDEHVIGLNKKFGKQVIFIAPVGQAVTALREKIVAGKMPGIEKQSELFTDKLGHPKAPLEVLVSYVHFAVVYRRSPVGLPMPGALTRAKNAKWDDKMNRELQEIAWAEVLRHPLSGVTKEK